MRALIGALTASWLALGGPACAQDKATIERLNERFVRAFQDGQMDALGQMYAADAVVLPAGSPLVKGREAIQAFWTKTAEGVASVALSTADVNPLGPDFAREIGTFRLTTKAQPPQELTGKYVVIWRKADGDWKLWTDIWNADK